MNRTDITKANWKLDNIPSGLLMLSEVLTRAKRVAWKSTVPSLFIIMFMLTRRLQASLWGQHFPNPRGGSIRFNMETISTCFMRPLEERKRGTIRNRKNGDRQSGVWNRGDGSLDERWRRDYLMERWSWFAPPRRNWRESRGDIYGRLGDGFVVGKTSLLDSPLGFMSYLARILIEWVHLKK